MVDIVTVTLVEIAVVRWQLGSSLLEGSGHCHCSQWQQQRWGDS